jgi:NAD(P)-dependent dehydrogenase (short-subunit alcohol dehydrogenase family)
MWNRPLLDPCRSAKSPITESADDPSKRQHLNAVSWLRVNRAVLPVMRRAGKGLLVYTGSGINRMPDPFTGPYAASKAAGDVLAEVMALETARYGIETVIVQPGAYTSGTDHFKHAVGPLDHEVARQYGKLEGLSDQLANRLDGANLPGRRTDVGEVAEAIRDIVAMASGTRPKRIDIDPQGREVGKINDLTARHCHGNPLWQPDRPWQE